MRVYEQFINLRKPEQPDAMYGWVKLTGEQMAVRVDGPSSVHIIRPMSGYGTDQTRPTRSVHSSHRAQARANPFDIWGDGTQVRDWVHVDDIMATIVRLIDQDYTQPINVGTGIPTDFTTLATMMVDAVGYTPTINPLPDRPTGVHWRVADPTALHQIHTHARAGGGDTAGAADVRGMRCRVQARVAGRTQGRCCSRACGFELQRSNAANKVKTFTAVAQHHQLPVRAMGAAKFHHPGQSGSGQVATLRVTGWSQA